MKKLAKLFAVLGICFVPLAAAQAATVSARASLIMVTWVNNANPPGIISPVQSSVGGFSGSGPTFDVAAKAAMALCVEAAKNWNGFDPAKAAITASSPTQISFVCVVSSN